MSRLKKYIFSGIIFVIIAGTISHFVYEWSGRSFLLSFFFPVNESTWEHMKLCFFPMLLYGIFMNHKLKKTFPCITSALCFGVLLDTFLIPVIFYTYSGILGRNFLSLDIATFIFSTICAFWTVYRFTLSCKLVPYTLWLKLFVALTALCFFIFSCKAPGIGLFRDPH